MIHREIDPHYKYRANSLNNICVPSFAILTMMYYIFLVTLVTFACGQKPNYLSGSVGHPDLAYRFRTNETSTPASLGDRLGGEGGTTPRIPVDARGDPELVNWLNTWPRENKPFWLLNYEKIEAMRNQGAAQSSNQVRNNQPVDLQQRFGASGNSRRNEPRDQRGFDTSFDYDDFGNRKN